jgi:replicative DNA helicase
MCAAVRISRYLIAQALTAFDLMGADPGAADARFILGWIERTSNKQFTVRDLMASVSRGRFAKVSALDSPLGLLEDYGYIRRLPSPKRSGAGRPPSPGTSSTRPSGTAEIATISTEPTE